MLSNLVYRTPEQFEFLLYHFCDSFWGFVWIHLHNSMYKFVMFSTQNNQISGFCVLPSRWISNMMSIIRYVIFVADVTFGLVGNQCISSDSLPLLRLKKYKPVGVFSVYAHKRKKLAWRLHPEA